MKDRTWKQRVVVCGSREFADYEFLAKTLDKLTKNFKSFCVLSGYADGADKLGEKWAFSRMRTVRRFRPDYLKHKDKAPLVRNTEMIEEATHLVAFQIDKSSGTQDAIDKARRKGIPVKVFEFKE